MPSQAYLFEIYRLNIVDENVLPFMGHPARTDADIARIIQASTDSRFDQIAGSITTSYVWSVRDFTDYGAVEGDQGIAVFGVTLARSRTGQIGLTVTPTSIEEARSEFSPAPAETSQLIFYMSRHLVVAEYTSSMMQSSVWRTVLHEIFDKSARYLEFASSLRLEPIPRDEEIISAFRSFQSLTRLRVTLRIPNPELDRRTERLRKDMLASSIREYTQDMRNPQGLSQNEEDLPFATAVMAQSGYKQGEVIMTGLRKGKRATVRTGKRAARGRMENLKIFVRGMAATARSKETQAALRSILEEVDQIAEVPNQPRLLSENESSS